MLEAALWGLIQGLTEFLPISSSGHLVLIPALFGQEGPDLATSAILHLGTLAAVLAYFRSDLLQMAKFDAPGRKFIGLLLLGTIPAAAIGLTFGDQIDEMSSNPRWVALALMATGILLIATRFIKIGQREVSATEVPDAVFIGTIQAFALIPGVSRSGMTISAALSRGYDPVQAARFSFLLGVPAIAGAGLLSLPDLFEGGLRTELLVGMLVAAVSGYAAIALLLRLMARIGLSPFGVYCIGIGLVALVVI